MRSIGRRIRPRSRAGWAAACAAVLVVGVASVASGATGDVIRIGKRTAGSGETAIVGNTSLFATRQSNNLDGDGGAASYGCRAVVTQEPCLFVLNHNTNGSVFRFQSDGGAAVGRIQVNPPAGKNASDTAPFTTNATGVATGLNADKVDGQSASDIVAATKPPLARVNADGTVAPGARGLATATPVQHVGVGDYKVTFASDVSNCAYSVTESTVTDAGAASAQPVAGSATAVEVATNGTSGRADRPFHIVVNC